MMTEYIVRVDEKRKAGDPKIDPLAYLYSLPVLEEVIRCRDCKNRVYSEEVCSDECKVTFDHIGTINGRDSYARRLVKPNDTCSWAERDE